ncbi:Mitochondrial pyruvate carrier 4 [Lathyrus oleraceus]|uniref:Mitochondrial pyruvate carrier n=1 Tax=Pisum sativum TaxID=3888 RepID=A0A9D5BNM3_PEA|nr:Mitochondrial pyruvate carrier 4 [Pisum sativum]
MASKLRALWNHPIGPKTVHFWAPTFKWGISIANIADFSKPPDMISYPQQIAVMATGLIWARYSTVITPKNWNLVSVNLAMAGTGIYQLSRKLRRIEARGPNDSDVLRISLVVVPTLTKLALNQNCVCCGPNIKDMGLFKVVFYTKGSFAKNARLRCEGGDIYAFSGQDSNFMSFFEACVLIKGMDSSFNLDDVKLWWKHEECCLETDLKPFGNDEDATMLALFSKKNSFDVEMYT